MFWQKYCYWRHYNVFTYSSQESNQSSTWMCSVCTESKLRTYNSVDLLKKVETKTKYLFLKLIFFRLLQLTVLHFEMATFLRQFMCLHIVGGSVSLGPCWKHCRRHMHHLTHFLPRVLLWKAPLQTSSSNYSEAVMLPSFCQDIMIFQTAVIFAELFLLHLQVFSH